MVVNAVTGEGVSKAKVDVYAGQALSVFSGPDGHFEMENVPEGQWQMMARKPGYFSDQEMSRGFFSPKMFRVTESGSDITLKLMPAATITGHVMDESGEPLEAAQVEVIAGAIENGRRTWQPRSGAQTDESGEYSMSSLIPGDYYVRVKRVNEAVARQPGQAYDEVYEGCYYPGAPTQEQAAVLHVAGGQQAQADFTLPRARGYRVSGQVANQVGFTLVSADRDGETFDQTAQVGKGHFRLSGLPPGQYSIEATHPDQNQPLFGEELVTVSQADVTNVQILMQQPQSIPVQIQVVKTKDEAAGIQTARSFLVAPVAPGSGPSANNGPRYPLGNIALTPDRTGHGMNYAQANPNGLGPNEQLALKGAFPGTYRVTTQAFPPYYIESIRSGSVDLLDQPLTISAGGAVAPIQITLRDDSATLTVNVMQDGQPAAGGAVLAIPTAHPSANESPRIWSGGNQLTLSGLAPGDYRVYAFDSLENLEYANPEALRPFSAQSQQVTLEPNGSTKVTLELIELSKQRSTP